MDIAAELQQEAASRAGSPEGFQQVIRLVLEDMNRGVEILPLENSTVPHWSTYISTFKQYAYLMKEIFAYKARISEFEGASKLEYAHMQKYLSDLINASFKNRRELPTQVYNRLIEFEASYSSRHAREYLYSPQEWKRLGKFVWQYVSRWKDCDGDSRTATQ